RRRASPSCPPGSRRPRRSPASPAGWRPAGSGRTVRSARRRPPAGPGRGRARTRPASPAAGGRRPAGAPTRTPAGAAPPSPGPAGSPAGPGRTRGRGFAPWPPPTPRPRLLSAGGGEPDGVGVHELADALDAHLPAHAALVEAAEGRPLVEVRRAVRVDERVSGTEPRGDAGGPLRIGRPDRGAQAGPGVVGAGHGVVRVVERQEDRKSVV